MRDRLKYLDGMRGIAALIVVMHHGILLFTFGLYSGNPLQSKFPWDMWLAKQPFVLFFAGNFSVAVFFLLSGFVLSHVFLRSASGPLALAAKRYVRLTVPITAANLLSLLLCCLTLLIPFIRFYIPSGPGFHGTWHSIPVALRNCLWEALYKATIAGTHGPAYNGVLWTMRIEFIGSLVLIAGFTIAKAVTKSPQAAANVAAVMAFVLAALFWQSHLALFAYGVLFYRVAMNGLPTGRWWAVVAVPLLILGVFLGTVPQSNDMAQFMKAMIRFTGITYDSLASKSLLEPIYNYYGAKVWMPFEFMPINLWHGFGAFFLMAAVLLSEALRSFFSSRPVVYLGRISFALYLTHGLFVRLVEKPIFNFLVANGVNSTVSLVCALAVFIPTALLIAHAFTALIEGRAMRWSERAEAWVGSFRMGRRESGDVPVRASR